MATKKKAASDVALAASAFRKNHETHTPHTRASSGGDTASIAVRMPNGSAVIDGLDNAKPTSAVALSLVSIPRRLKKLDRWILWKYTLLPNGKWTKTPHSASGGHKVDATDFANGASFETAVQALRKNESRFDGLGFLLGDGIAGIDVDDCIGADGVLDERGRTISEQYRGTYAEVSPSGRGFKVLVDIGADPKLAEIGKNTKEMEIYGGRRYFTVTGAALPGHALTIAPMADAFATTAAQLGAKSSEGDEVVSAKPPLGIDLTAARELLDHLPFKWCDEYGEWIRTGMSLHHEFGASASALALWDEYSQRSPKFDPGGCAEKWETFNRTDGEIVTIRTVVREAEATGWRAPHKIAAAIRDFDLPEWLANARAGRFDLSAVPQTKWLHQGITPRGKVIILGGAGGSSKSYFALTLAAHWVAGKTFDVFEPVHHGAADEALVLFAEEDDDDLHRRFATTVATAGFTPDEMESINERLLLRSLLDLTDDLALAEYDPSTRRVRGGELFHLLERALQSRPQIRWVIADPLVLLHHLEENDNKGMAQLLGLLGRLARRTGAAVWLVHHLSKTGAAADALNMQHVRGASAIVDNSRGVLLMQRLQGDDAAIAQVTPAEARQMVRLSFAKNSYGPPRNDRYLHVRDDGSVAPAAVQPMPVPAGVARAARAMATKEQATQFREDAAMRALLMLLQKGSKGTAAIYAAKPGSYSRKTIEPLLPVAVDAGWLSVQDAPRNGKLYTLLPAGQMHIDGETL